MDHDMFAHRVESIGFSARYIEGAGWHLVFFSRRSHQQFDDRARATYDRLSDPELTDVVLAELETRLWKG